jgi:hypothetical protein
MLPVKVNKRERERERKRKGGIRPKRSIEKKGERRAHTSSFLTRIKGTERKTVLPISHKGFPMKTVVCEPNGEFFEN